MAAGSLLSYVDILSHYFPFFPLLLLFYSHNLLLLSLFNYLSTYPSRLNSTPLLSSFLSILFSILLQLLSMPNSPIFTLLLPYSLLLVLLAPPPPLHPCLQDETDMDPTLCRHYRAPSSTSISLKYLLSHLQVSFLQFARTSRTTQVRSMLDSLVLTKRIYRIKRIKRRCESHSKRQRKSHYILIHTRPPSNECHRYIFIWTIPRPSWEWITTTLFTLATYVSWNCYSKRYTTYSSSISTHITDKYPCTTKSKSVLQCNTKLTRPNYSLKYISTKNQNITVQALYILFREYPRLKYTSNSLQTKWTSPKPQRSKINNREYDHNSSKFDPKTSHMIAVASNNNVIQCNNLRSQTILHILSKAQTVLQKQLSNVLTQTSQPTQNTNNPTNIFIIKLHNKKAIYHPSDSNNQTVSILLDIYTKTHHYLPPSCRLSFANKTVCLDTPLNQYSHYSFPIFNIILPILGGMNPANNNSISGNSLLSPPGQNTQPSPSTEITQQSTSHTSKRKHHSRKISHNIINRENFTIRIATINCNGAPKRANNNENNLIWQFVQEAKIDVLYLIDHRSSNRNMEFLRQSGEKYLNQDIRLINSEITLLQPLNHRLGPDTSYHATVGGCAILTFGSLSHITFPTTFLDPSGANTFIGAKIQYHSSHPPIFLNAIYLFPPSPGPTTLATRISKYLTQLKITTKPCEWQLDTLYKLLQKQYDENPGCVQIIGGDFNHSKWSSIKHPISDTFMNKLSFTNAAYNLNTQSNDKNSQIYTFNNSSHWIDHFLHTGKAKLLNYRTYRDSPVCTYTDHIPYTNDYRIYIPTAHYNIPKNMNYKAASFMKATHLQRCDTVAIELLENEGTVVVVQ